MFEIIKWPEDMDPKRCPIHSTNELEVAASPETIWSPLTDTHVWRCKIPSGSRGSISKLKFLSKAINLKCL